jgi:hypothetical protein
MFLLFQFDSRPGSSSSSSSLQWGLPSVTGEELSNLIIIIFIKVKITLLVC